MISPGQIVLLVILAVALYLIFNVLTMPAVARNILGIVLGVVLVAVIINLIFGVFPF